MKRIILDFLIATAVAVFSFCFGYFVWGRPEIEKEEKITLETVEHPAADYLDAQENTDFVNYVINKFDFTRDGFTLLEQNDDAVKTKTDLLVEIEDEFMVYNLSVECIWLQDLPAKGLYWANEVEMKSMMEIADKEDSKIILIAGIGGTATDPKSLFIVPIKFLQQRNLPPSELANYKCTSTNGLLSYDGKLMTLK